MAGSLFRPRYRRAGGQVVQSAVWWMKFYDGNGRCIRESTETDDKREAQRALTVRVAGVLRGEPVRPHVGRVTVADLVADVLTDYRVNGKRSLQDAERRWEKHLRPAVGMLRAASVGTDTVRRYQAHRQEQGASNATINREVALLRRAFTLASQAMPPKVTVRPYMPALAEDNARHGFFEPAQFAAVMDSLPSTSQPVVAFAYQTGWRVRSEVLPLQWRQVDFDAHDGRGEVRLEPGTTKNKKGRTFVLTAELRELLVAQRKATDTVERKHGIICPYVFHRHGKPIRSLYRAWRSACRKAGCPGMILHDFRRTAIRAMVRAGISEKVAMEMSGHRTRSVFDRYDVTGGRDLTEAAAKLDAAAPVNFVTGKVTGKVATMHPRRRSVRY